MVKYIYCIYKYIYYEYNFFFQPECKVSDDMRFTAYNQYVHRMLHRWGPNVKEMMAIKKYLATQSITLTHPPWVEFYIYNFFLYYFILFF